MELRVHSQHFPEVCTPLQKMGCSLSSNHYLHCLQECLSSQMPEVWGIHKNVRVPKSAGIAHTATLMKYWIDNMSVQPISETERFER